VEAIALTHTSDGLLTSMLDARAALTPSHTTTRASVDWSPITTPSPSGHRHRRNLSAQEESVIGR
jgi:hypothetical protein